MFFFHFSDPNFDVTKYLSGIQRDSNNKIIKATHAMMLYALEASENEQVRYRFPEISFSRRNTCLWTELFRSYCNWVKLQSAPHSPHGLSYNFMIVRVKIRNISPYSIIYLLWMAHTLQELSEHNGIDTTTFVSTFVSFIILKFQLCSISSIRLNWLQFRPISRGKESLCDEFINILHDF